MDKAEIYEWLKSQKYQTGYDEVGEYVMYYSVDMPRILEDYYEYKVKKLNKPAVSKREGVICEHPMQDRYYTYADTYWCTNCERVIIDSEFKQPVGGGSVCGDCWGSGWEQQFIEPCKKCNGTGKI